MQLPIKHNMGASAGASQIHVAPAFAALPPPVIIIGMHRSGTSMVAGLLQLMGAYMDPVMALSLADGRHPGEDTRRSGYGEAVPFRLVNETMLARAGSDWYHVDRFLETRENKPFADWCTSVASRAMYGPLHTDYLSVAPTRPAVWGWKDPRNSLTLQYWLTLFPQARVIFVRREPEAIIRSLVAREQAQTAQNYSLEQASGSRIQWAARHPAEALKRAHRKLTAHPVPPRPVTHEEWLRLVNQYTAQCDLFRNHPGGFLEVYYEEIVKDPIRNTSILSDFAGLHAPLARILDTAGFVLSDRRPSSETRLPPAAIR